MQNIFLKISKESDIKMVKKSKKLIEKDENNILQELLNDSS